MGKSAPTLTDGIVLLNRLEVTDIEAHLAGEDEEQARRFGWYPKRSTEQTVRRSIIAWQKQWREVGPIRTFAVRLISNRALVGGCQVGVMDVGPANISYWIFPGYRGRGLATRAVGLLTEWALDELPVDLLEIRAESDNIGSKRVAERAGFMPTEPVHWEHGTQFVSYFRGRQ